MAASRLIQPQKYKQKIYYLEYLLPLLAISAVCIPLNFLQTFTLLTIALALKYKLQGFRVNFPIVIFTLLIACTGFFLPTVISSLLSLLSTYILIVYKLPTPRSMIGCKTVLQDTTLFTIFYPTTATRSPTTTSIFKPDTGSRMFDVINKDPGKPSKLPYRYIRLSSGYYTKLKVKNVVPNAPCVEKEYEVIVVSHQLGFNTSHSFVQEFVEAGYMVVLLDHEEQIRNIHPEIDSLINKEFRTQQLHARYNTASKTLDYLLDDAKLAHLFSTPNIRIDKNNVHMMGHSFGGSTTLYTAINDKRITGCALCYDPCFYILSDSYTLHNQQLLLSNKILILLAEDYYQKHYPFFENQYRAQVFKRNCANARVLRMLGVNHANYSELSLFSAGQFHRLNVVRNDKMRLYFEMTMALSHQVLRRRGEGEGVESQEGMIEELIENNGKWKEEILGTLRSIREERHERMMVKVM